MTPEFSRPIAVPRIGGAPLEVTVTATEKECRALAARMALPAIGALECRFVLRRNGSAVMAAGHLRARVTQVCVVSLDEFETPIEEDFAVRFVPAGTEAEAIDPEREDEIPYEADRIDLGEAAAQQLALALDPYPRKPGATLEAEPPAPASPFAALACRRRQH